jgi:hypothetical protein
MLRDILTYLAVIRDVLLSPNLWAYAAPKDRIVWVLFPRV